MKATDVPGTSHRVIRRGRIYWIEPSVLHATSFVAAATPTSESAPSDSSPPPSLEVPGAGVAHPHVVVQDDIFNESRIPTVIVCALTSNLKRASEPGNVLLDAGEGDLPKQSVVVVSQLDVVDKARLGEYVGELSQARVEQVLDGLRFQQASFFARS